MKLFAFHFVIEKDSRSFDEWVEDLYEAGGDDATAGMNGEIPFVSFDRESESLVEAIHSARATLRKAGLKPIRVEIEESVLEEALSHVS